jgi:hypothetical protein
MQLDLANIHHSFYSAVKEFIMQFVNRKPEFTSSRHELLTSVNFGASVHHDLQCPESGTRSSLVVFVALTRNQV